MIVSVWTFEAPFKYGFFIELEPKNHNPHAPNLNGAYNLQSTLKSLEAGSLGSGSRDVQDFFAG